MRLQFLKVLIATLVPKPREGLLAMRVEILVSATGFKLVLVVLDAGVFEFILGIESPAVEGHSPQVLI